MPFESVVGHERIRTLLAGALAQGRLPPALLLCGPEGVGKRTLALATARALLCPQARAGKEACDACPPCHRTAKGLHPDLFLIEPESSSIKIEQVREAVREICGRPFESRARAFVVDEAHLMTEQAANALLKGLEEPPASSHVFLVTASPQALLPTVRSRCQVLRFGPLPSGVLERFLREGHGLSAAEARLRASVANGSVGLALSFESDSYRRLRDELLILLEGLARSGSLERLEAAERLADVDDLPMTLTALRSLLRDLAALWAGSRAGSLLNADVADRLQALADGALGARAAALAEAVGETREALRGNANKLLSADVLLDSLA